MNKDQRIAELEAENTKLRRINHALIERVESGQNHSRGPYAAFEHSVILAEQVRDRTDALNNALSELKISHQALRKVKDQAAATHQRLIDAIESISDAFVLFDSTHRILLFNDKFSRIWQQAGVIIETGMTFAELKQLGKANQFIIQRIAPNKPDDQQIVQLFDKRWIQISEHPTADDGLVVLYTDITALKQQEQLSREKALAKKSYQIHRTLENLAQGIVLINPDGRIELWNNSFTRLTGIDEQLITPTITFRALAEQDNQGLLKLAATITSGSNPPVIFECRNGSVIEVQGHSMPEGGTLKTFTDITERHQHAEELRQSEQWIRLITDNIPALIAYVDQDLTLRFTNKVYNQWYGNPESSLKGRSILSVHGEQQFSELSPYIEQALTGQQVTFEIEEKSPQGKTRYMLKSYVPKLESDRSVSGFFVLIQDITERRKTEEELQAAYQLMEKRVHDRTSELVTVNSQLRSEIDERRLIELQLRTANQQAEQANLSKTKFLAAVSHDLLQPLNAARLFTAALLDQPLDEKPSKLANSLSHSLSDVESLLNTLVDISKLDAGVVEPDINTFAVNELLQNLANEYQQIAQAKQLQFNFHSSNRYIQTDSQLLARILRNFLSNAIRYTNSGRIVLGVRHQQNSISIQVLDTGPGIPTEKQSEIFQEFHRLDEALSSTSKALGLGLAIVDKIARVLNHPIAVHSSKGKGSMFSVTVPCLSTPPSTKQTGPTLNDASHQLAGTHVWVIDNDISICDGMEQLLSSWGCSVITATSQQQLQLKTDKLAHPCDLIIADYHLDHNENGLDTVSAILKAVPAPIPVLMITANYCQELKQEIRKQGYLLMNKPVRPLKLKTMIAHLLQ